MIKRVLITLTLTSAMLFSVSNIAKADWMTSSSTGYTYQADTFGNINTNSFMYSSNGTQTDIFGSPTQNNSLTTGSYLGTIPTVTDGNSSWSNTGLGNW